MLEHQKPHPLDDLLDPPTVAGMLGNIPGGEPNLLPVALVRDSLRVDVPRWLNSNPQPGRGQTLRLYWDEQLVDEKTWERPIEDDELFIEVPVNWLREGQARVAYTVMLWNCNSDESETLTLTIDTTEPKLGGARGELSFPELGSDTLTEDYLKAHDDVLEAELPLYDEPGAGDTLIFYWNTQPFENVEAGRRVLTREDIGKPLLIAYTGELIRERGDGPRYAFYEVQDRAGNLSRPSQPITVDVAAQPVPRVLPWLEVPDAEGSGEVKVLALYETDGSVGMVIPDEAVIRSGESFTVQWGEPTLFCSLSMPGQSEVREYSVPIRNVVAMSGKTLSVYYEVETSEGLQRSVERKVNVTPVPRLRLPTPQLAGHGTGQVFRLRDHSVDPQLTLDKWKHIGVDQRVNILVKGVSATGGAEHPVLHSHVLTPQEVTDGIGKDGNVRIPLDFLRNLLLGEMFYVEVKVSFDEGNNWPSEPNFPRLELQLGN